MKVYSETIFHFIQRCEKLTKEILKLEMGVEVFRSRFLYKGILYPINLVVVTGEKQLASFNPHNYQISFNKKLIYQVKEPVLKNIIRHELAHYWAALLQIPHTPHGDLFKTICKSFGWDDEVFNATMNIDLENEKLVGPFQDEKVINKIKNLLKLASSNNIHEAELATLKANQLLIKHNIDLMNLKSQNEVYVLTLCKEKRRSQKIITIYEIIKNFLVSPILNYDKEGVSLEILGEKSNIELAEYVFHFLNQELDRMWEIEKQMIGSNIKNKNSFFMGIARGYDEKMQNLKNELTVHDQKSLVLIEKNIQDQFKKVFPNTRGSSSQSQIAQDAFLKGKQKGHSLTIHSAIKNSTIRGYLT